MTISSELSIASEALERLKLEKRIVTGLVIDRFGLDNEETAVDPTFADLRFLDEIDHRAAFNHEAPEMGGRANCCYIHQLSVLPVES